MYFIHVHLRGSEVKIIRFNSRKKKSRNCIGVNIKECTSLLPSTNSYFFFVLVSISPLKDIMYNTNFILFIFSTLHIINT